MNLNFIKKYLRVDFDDDDDFILLLWEVAKKYVVNSVGQPALNEAGEVDETNPLVKLLELTIISTLYEERSFTVNKSNEKLQYTLRSIILQLQLEGD